MNEINEVSSEVESKEKLTFTDFGYLDQEIILDLEVTFEWKDARLKHLDGK